MSKSYFIKVVEDVSFLRIPIVIDPDIYFKRKGFEHGVFHKFKCILKISCPATSRDQVGISFPLELSRTALKETLDPIRWRIFFPNINGMHVIPFETEQQLDFYWFGKSDPNTLYNNDKANNGIPIDAKIQKQLVWVDIPKEFPEEEFGYKTFLTKTWYLEETFNITANEREEIDKLYENMTMEELVVGSPKGKNASSDSEAENLTSLESIAEYLLEKCIKSIRKQTSNRNDKDLNEALRQNGVTFSLELRDDEQGFSVGACETIDPFLPPEEDKKDSEPSPR